VVSDSPLLSAPAEAVEAIHGVMPPVLFQGFSWAGLYWPRSELSATLYMLHTMTMPTANCGEIPCYFSVRLKNQLNNFSRKVFGYSSSTSYSKGLRRSIRVPSLQPYENNNFDLTITLLTPYKPNFEWHLKKTPRSPLETEVNLSLRKNGSTGLRTMGLRRHRKIQKIWPMLSR